MGSGLCFGEGGLDDPACFDLLCEEVIEGFGLGFGGRPVAVDLVHEWDAGVRVGSGVVAGGQGLHDTSSHCVA